MSAVSEKQPTVVLTEKLIRLSALVGFTAVDHLIAPPVVLLAKFAMSLHEGNLHSRTHTNRRVL
jgi:hypothetical protein